MTMLAPVAGLLAERDWLGNVAKGCHSRRGLDDMDRQENLWIGWGNVKRMAWVDSACAVNVQRRRRIQGYMRSKVMRVRFQEVGDWMSKVIFGVEVDVAVWEARIICCIQNNTMDVQPRKRWVSSKELW
jgi:hypothetical protein